VTDGTDREAPESVMKHRPFQLFWGGRAASVVAFQMQGVAVGWQIYALTGSAWYLGLVGLAQFLPMFLLTLIVGQVADRYNRRTITVVCLAVQGIVAMLLALASYGGWQSKESILLLAFIGGAARAFERPTTQAMMPGLVPARLFPQAAAWSSASNQTAAIAGPAVGGILYGLGPTTVYGVTTLMFLAAIATIALIRSKAAPMQLEPFSLQTLFAGITFIRSRPTILGAISLDLFAVLLGGATALLPVYARDILHTGPWGLGLLRGAPAMGALVMSLWLARNPLRRRAGRVMFASVAAFGLGTIVFALSTSFALSLLSLIILGGADVISVVIRSALVQINTPDGMRGRVSAVNSLFIGTSNQLGEFESGTTAALFGTVPAVVIGGIGTLLVVLLWMRLFPELAAVETLEGEQ
jgi:MFS family permease